jgi:hypothetical protein
MTTDETLLSSTTDINNKNNNNNNNNSSGGTMLQRARSQDMVDDHHDHIVDEDPLLISQSLTYVTDDGSVLHSFRSSPFSMGTFLLILFLTFKEKNSSMM